MAANANRERMPPPPPNHGFQQAPPGMVQGGPPMNRPPQAQQAQQPRQQQYAPGYQQNFQQQGGPTTTYRADTVINSSTRIHDIRPEKTESESFCKKQLTSYEVFTILPSNDDDGKDSKGSKGNKDSKDSKDKKKDNWGGWGGKDNKDKGDTKSKKRERWAKVTINQESYPTEQIIKTIQKLDAGKYSITDKKAKLYPNQSMQVTSILDDKIMKERDGQFEWVLAQLHREESTNSKTGKKETTSMTIYLKRAPLPGLDVIQIYRERQERARIQALQREQAQMNAQIFQQQQQQAQAMHQNQQQQQQQMGNGQYMPQRQQQPQQMGGGQYMPQRQQQQQQQQKGDAWPKPAKSKNAPAGVKIVQNDRPGTPGGHKSPKGGKFAGTKVRMMDSDGYSTDSFSGSDSDSDSDFSHYDSEGTPHTSASSRSGGGKYPRTHRPLHRSRERRRGSYHSRSEDFVMIDSPNRRRSLSYAPDVPRIDRPRVNSYGQQSPAVASPGIDAETFAIAVAAATRAAIAQPAAQYPAPAPRMISNIERAANDDARLREEQRLEDAEEIMRRDAMRDALAREAVAKENVMRSSRMYERDLPSDVGRGYAAPPPRRYLDEDRERVYREPPRMSPSVSSMSSAPLSPLPRERGRSDRWSPEPRRRSPEYGYPLRSKLQRIPLEEDRQFDYSRNPFQPRREPARYGY
ncbi:hypothetical protein ACLOAV_007380 [Pseudogymnoascus australis]